jgi:hypothetical protein
MITLLSMLNNMWYIILILFYCRFGLSNRFDAEFPQALCAKVCEQEVTVSFNICSSTVIH